MTDRKNVLLILLLGILAWAPTLNFWFFKAYEATWLLGVPQNPLGLIKAHAFLYYIDWKMFGWNPWGWYLTSIVLHLIAAVLLYKLIQLISGNKLLSFAASIIFVASTAYNDVLTWGSFNSYYPLLLTWMLSALISFIKYKKTERKIYLILSLCFSFLAFFTRETGIVTVALITSYDLFFSTELGNKTNILRIFKRQLPFYLSILVFFLIRSVYGGTPGDSADSNVKLQLRFVEDRLYWDYAKTSFLTLGKLIPPQIVPYPILNGVREIFTRFNMGIVSTYFFPLLGWTILLGLGTIWLKTKKSLTDSRIFLFSLAWVGLFSVFVALALPNTPEVLAREYEYNTMRYRYFAFVGMSILTALIIVRLARLKSKTTLLFILAFAFVNLVLIWRIERDIYVSSYKPAKDFYMKFNSYFPEFSDAPVFYIYPHAAGLSDYLLEWYLIKGKDLDALKKEPYIVETQVIAVLDKIKKGKLDLEDVFFLDQSEKKGLINETEKARRILLNQKKYLVNVNKSSSPSLEVNVNGPFVEIPYNVEINMSIGNQVYFSGDTPNSQKFRTLIDYSVGKNNYLNNSKIKTAYTMSQREGEPFYHVLPNNLVDGNTGFRYSWIADSWEPWVEVDLGSVIEISAVIWGSLEGSTRVPASYSISISEDGKKWAKVKEIKNSVDFEKIDSFDRPYNARFVRMDIHTTSGGDFVLIDEFEVVPSSSGKILTYYKKRSDLLRDAYKIFSFAENTQDISYAKDSGLNSYWGRLSWGTSDSETGDNNQSYYFRYNILNSDHILILELKESEIYSGSGNFLKESIDSIRIEFGNTPFDFTVNYLELVPRYKL